MSTLEKRRVDREFHLFASANFEKPKKCKNLEQVRYYIKELSNKVEELKNSFGYVPSGAYTMLANYNAILNRYMHEEFKNTY